MQTGKNIFQKLTIALLLLMLYYTNSAYAQSYPLKNYSIKAGLPSSEAYFVMQDSKGYIWVCSDGGVSRFNGYTFTTYNITNGLPDNNIFEAIEDYKSRIWFRSYSGALSYYYHDSVFNLPINNSLKKLLKNTLIASLAVDSSDNVYLGLLGGHPPLKIDIRNHYSLAFIPIRSQTSYICHTPYGGVISGHYYLEDSANCNADVFGVYNISINNKANLVKEYDTLHPAGKLRHDKAIRLSNGDMAFTLGATFFCMDKHSDIIYSHTMSSIILDITGDKNNVWITTAEGAPVCYSKNKIINYPALTRIKDRRLTSVALDAEGGMWFTSLYDGVYYLPSVNFNVWNAQSGLPGNKVDVLAVAPDSTLWISVFRNNKLTLLQNDSLSYRTIPGIPGVSINGLLFYKDNSVWIGTSNGILSLKNKMQLNATHWLTQSVGRDMVQNADGTLWYNGEGRVLLLKKTGNTAEVIKSLDVGSQRIFDICTGTDSSLWINSVNGLWRYKNDSLVNWGERYPLFKNRIKEITETPGNILLAPLSEAGLLIQYKKQILHITAANGLMNNYCTCIACDYRGDIWVSSHSGISEIIVQNINGDSLVVKSIKKIDNPNLTEINCIACIGPMMYVGTNNGLTSFNINNLSTDTVPPPVYISGININSKPANINTAALHLQYNQNYIVINYVGLDYTDAGNIKYRYKMDGIDTGWVYSQNTTVQYPELSPGQYKFEVSAMNHDGLWNTMPATMDITILPPWWDTWWARLLAIVTIAGFIYWRIKAIQQQERKKTELNRQLAVAELQKIKAQFDPHFLFNNLNTLSSLIDTTPNNAQEFVDELSLFYQYTIKHSAEEFTHLQSEIEQATRYFSLLAIRYGKQLAIEWHINNNYLNRLILTNSLQILLENVVKHNNILSGDKYTVTIKTTDTNSIIITNPIYAKKSSTSTGIGLNSIRERYRLLTQKNITISRSSDYFSVELPLIIPGTNESINHRR